MSTPTRDERTAASASRGLIEQNFGDVSARSHESAPALSIERRSIFEPLEHRRLLSTTSFEAATTGNIGSSGYTDNGYKFVNLPGYGGTSQGDLMVYGTKEGFGSKVLSTINWGRKIVVNRTDGAAFSLASFDYTGGRWGEAGDATVTGYLSNGSTQKTSYSFSGKSSKKLSLNWTDLKKVEVNFAGGSNDAYGSVDNFVFGSGTSGGGFEEKSGRVDLPAESFTGQGSGSGSAVGSNWSVLSDTSADGGKIISSTPNAGVNTGDGTNGPRRDYGIKFNTTGTYYVWVRMKATSGSDDSVHVGLNGSARSLGSQGLALEGSQRDGKWAWANTTAAGSRVTVNVGSTGTHTFNLWMREDGSRVDGVILTKDASFNPNGSTDSGGGDSGGGGDSNATKPTPRISVVGSLNVMAGMSVHVNALSSSFGVGDMDTARFEWDFGDPNGQRNTVTGWNAAHFYQNSGTYTIKLKVWNQSLGYAETTATVNVASNSRKKVYVSPSGSDSNSGTSSSSPVKTIVRAVQLMRNNNGNVEILLQRGARHDLATPQSIDRQNVLIGAYGSGSNPVVWWTRGRYDTKPYFLLGYGTNNVTVRDLTFDTPYGSDTDATNMPHALQPAGTNITIYNNEFRHVGDAVAGNAVPTGVLVLNNKVPSDTMLRRYFAWIEGSDWTILGNTVPNSTREHIVRVGNGSRINVSHNTFTNLDRRSAGDTYDYAKGVLNIQKGSYAYIAHNTANGPSGVGPLGGSDGINDTSARFRHAVFDSNRINGQFHVEPGAEEVEVRNNIFRNNGDLNLSIKGYDATYNRTVKNLVIANNTGVNDSDRGQFIRVWGTTSGVIVSNNLYYAPSLYAGPWETAIVRVDASSLSGFSKIDKNVWADASWLNWAGGLMWVGTGGDNTGYLDKSEWNSMPQVGEDKFSDSPIDSSYKPASGSTAATAGNRVAGVMVDFYGKWRPNQDGRPVGAVTL